MIMGIGAGALLSAIAYELIPKWKLGGAGMAVTFCLGAIAFFGADWIIDHRGGADRKDIAGNQAGGSGAAIFVGTLLDNVPELLILGMSVALGGAINLAFLAAVFVSNLPEGVAGSINLETSGHSRRTIFWMWTRGDHIGCSCGIRLCDDPLAAGRGWKVSPGLRRRSHADHAGGCHDARGL